MRVCVAIMPHGTPVFWRQLSRESQVGSLTGLVRQVGDRPRYSRAEVAGLYRPERRTGQTTETKLQGLQLGRRRKASRESYALEGSQGFHLSIFERSKSRMNRIWIRRLPNESVIMFLNY